MPNSVLYSVFLSNLLTTLKVALTAHTSSLALFFIALSLSPFIGERRALKHATNYGTNH
jgi:hypothetical protein